MEAFDEIIKQFAEAKATLTPNEKDKQLSWFTPYEPEPITLLDEQEDHVQDVLTAVSEHKST